jgi:hypothetical protein
VSESQLAAVLMLDFACRQRCAAPFGTTRPDYERAYKAFWRAYHQLSDAERRHLQGPYGALAARTPDAGRGSK